MTRERFTIQVEKREHSGTSHARRLRRAGCVPAVLYGHSSEATALTLSEETAHAAMDHTGLVNLKIPGRRARVDAILKETQVHPITGHILHLDFQEVKADELITTMLEIEPHGEPAGEQHGGQLEQVLHELEIRCLPGNLPESLVVDVSGLELDQTMHVADLALPEGVAAVSDAELPVFQVRIPRMEPVEEEVGEEEGLALEEAEAAEPELVGRKETEQEAEEDAESE